MEEVQILMSKKKTKKKKKYKIMETVDMGLKNIHTASILFDYIFATKFCLQFLVYKVCAF